MRNQYQLSILVPARNEEWLARTVQDLLENIEGDTEILVGLDGEWANPGIPLHERVKVIYYPESIGQRAVTNQLCRLSSAKYVMKVDAHCSFDQGFDVKLMADMQDDWTVVPLMRNLHVFNLVCKSCKSTRYQGPTLKRDGDKEVSVPCGECGGTEWEREVVWIAKPSPQSTSYCFDSEPHFQYFGEYSKRPEAIEQGDLVETMSLQGSCFMLTREKYWELDICGEDFGSWGSQGIEVAVKTWLSGGRVICNKKTWYAHLFRTQGGNFGFPYELPGSQVQKAKDVARDKFFAGKFEKQIRPLSWLVEKFWPVPGWTQEELDQLKAGTLTKGAGLKKGQAVKKPKKGIVYYTDNRVDPVIGEAVRKQILKGMKEKHIVSVSLEPLDFGGKNIHYHAERGYLTMAKQILAGLEESDADVIFFCEHDVLYDPSHFDFVPPTKDMYYYNMNVWQVRASDGHAIYYDTKKLSQLCAYRELLIKHYRKRVEMLEEAYNTLPAPDFDRYVREMGFEPGTHNREARVDDVKAGEYRSKTPNIDIRHDKNATPSRWSQEQFRDKRNCQNWKEASTVEGWNYQNFMEFVRSL